MDVNIDEAWVYTICQQDEARRERRKEGQWQSFERSAEDRHRQDYRERAAVLTRRRRGWTLKLKPDRRRERLSELLFTHHGDLLIDNRYRSIVGIRGSGLTMDFDESSSRVLTHEFLAVVLAGFGNE